MHIPSAVKGETALAFSFSIILRVSFLFARLHSSGVLVSGKCSICRMAEYAPMNLALNCETLRLGIHTYINLTYIDILYYSLQFPVWEYLRSWSLKSSESN